MIFVRTRRSKFIYPIYIISLALFLYFQIVSCAAVDIALLLAQLKAGITTALNIDKTASTIAVSTKLNPFLCTLKITNLRRINEGLPL